jgi:hypothetical protein
MPVKLKIYFAHEIHEKMRNFTDEGRLARFSWVGAAHILIGVMPEVHEEGQLAARRAEIIQDLCAILIN